MGYINPENLKVKKLPFSYAVYNLEMIKTILKYQPEAGIHIFVDTGMHREGIRVDDLTNFIKALNRLMPILKDLCLILQLLMIQIIH